MRDDFAVFILSHGRPEHVSITITALKRANYSGRWFILLDTGDKTADEYRTRWGAERILTFSKEEIEPTFDLADNGGSTGVIVYARNAVEQIAADMGLSYYMQLDDDFSYFLFRFATLPDGSIAGPEDSLVDSKLAHSYVRDLDGVVDALIDFLEDSGALTVAMAQGGDFIGGSDKPARWRNKPMMRKAMNTFITRVGRPIRFVGRLNEDVNAYVWRGGQGELFLTTTDLAIVHTPTQSQPGGMTEAYLDRGTYLKSFYTVMFAPSCTKIASMGESHRRIHHNIAWNTAVPKILSSRYKA